MPMTDQCPVCGKVILLSLISLHFEHSCKKSKSQVRSTATSTCLDDKIDKKSNTANITTLTVKKKCAPSLNTQDDFFGDIEELAQPSKISSSHFSEKDEAVSRIETEFVERKSAPICSLNTQEELFGESEEVMKTFKRKSCHVSEKNEAESRRETEVVEKKKVVTVSIKNRTAKCYDLEQFNFVLKTVLNDPSESCLFNEWEKEILDTLSNLSDDAKKLYVKMHRRKIKWYRVSKVHYPDIKTDINVVIEELLRADLFDTEPMDLDILDELTVSELRTILRLLRLKRLRTTGKSSIIDLINKSCREQGTIFPRNENLQEIVVQKAKKIFGPCFRIEAESLDVFNRVLLIFSLTSYYPADNIKTSGNPALFTLFSVNSDKTVYPKYTTLKETKIFRNRDDLIWYELFDQAEQEMISLSASKEWDALLTLYQFCKEKYTIETGRSLRHLLELPGYLSRYSSNAAWIRCQNIALNALERLGRFEEANDLLKILLAEELFHEELRDRWLFRTAVILHKHLKKPAEALRAVIDGLNDVLVYGKYRLFLYKRGSIILESKDTANQTAEFEDLRKKFEKCDHFLTQDIPETEIEGRLLPNNNPGQKSTFESNDDFVCSVDELAIKRYRAEGYDQELYGESRIFASIFALIFWDIIYKDGIPNVFRSPYQSHPLDLNTPLFYKHRRVEIDEKLYWIGATSHKNICYTIEEKWKLHFGKLSLVNWDGFSGVEQLQSLIMCINCDVLSLICGRIAKDYFHYQGGFPDLVVWNETERKFKVVEVKGPKDYVYPQQMIWLDFLVEIGVDAEICSVSSVGAKKSKKDDDDDETQLKDDGASK